MLLFTFTSYLNIQLVEPEVIDNREEVTSNFATFYKYFFTIHSYFLPKHMGV